MTARNAGAGGVWKTIDDDKEPRNTSSVEVAVDWTPGDENEDVLKRLRGLYCYHSGGSVFVFGDGSMKFVTTEIDASVYRGFSAHAGGEVSVGI